MLTHRVGAASRAGGANMAAYLAAGAQQPVQEHNAAIYYTGQDKGLAEPANAILSPDLSPVMAQRLGIDRARPLSVGEVANLMAGLTAQGDRVEGKRYRSAGVSLGAVFGISGAREEAGATKVMRMLRPEELAHALAGRRIDGTAVQLSSQKRPGRMTKKELAIVAGAQKRLRTALGLPADGDPTRPRNIWKTSRPARWPTANASIWMPTAAPSPARAPGLVLSI
jgi:hypothetical protein